MAGDNVSDDRPLVMSARGLEFHLGCLYDYRSDRISSQSLANPLLFRVETRENRDGNVIKLAPIASVHLIERTEMDNETLKISIGKFPEKLDNWAFFEGTTRHKLFGENALLEWEIHSFLWDGKSVFDDWPGLDHHSKVCLLSNPPNSNLVWFHEIDASNQVAAVLTLQCQTNRLEMTVTDHLAREHSWNGGTGDATHLVTAIQYGIQVSFVFQRYLKKGEAIQDAQGETLSFIDKLSLAISSKDLKRVSQNEMLAVTIYGLNGQVKQLNCAETLELLESLVHNQSPDELNHFIEPLNVSLSRLAKITEKLQDLHDDDLKVCRIYFDGIDSLRAQANTLLSTNDGVKHFTYVRPLLHAYRKMLDKNKELARSELRRAVIKLRNKSAGPDETIERIAQEGGAICRASKEWLQDLTSEVRILNTIACHAKKLSIPLALDEDDIYRFLTDVDYEYVVAFLLPPIGRLSHFSPQHMKSYRSGCSTVNRGEFYEKARQFFKAASTCRETVNGPTTGFFMTPIALQTATSGDAHVLVFQNGTLIADEVSWLSHLQPERPTQRSRRGDGGGGMKMTPTEEQSDSSNGVLGFDGCAGSNGNSSSAAIGSDKVNGSYGGDIADVSQLLSLSKSKDSSINEGCLTPDDTARRNVEKSSTGDLSMGSTSDLKNKRSASNQTTDGSRLSLMSSQDSLASTKVATNVLKHAIRDKSRLVTSNSERDVYALAMTSRSTSQVEAGKAKRYAFNESAEFGESVSVHHRTVLLMGASGSGKTSLIRSMVNYVFGVKWDDDFRFEVPHARANQDSLTTYDINYVQGMKVPFSLTVIDTPGYTGDQGADDRVTESISRFFKEDDQVVDAVCFVRSAHPNTSVKAQEFILHSMLGLFGKDIKDNIHMFFTFTDSQPSAVRDVVRKAKSVLAMKKETKHYLISNVAFFGKEGNVHDLWCGSMASLKRFFDGLMSVQSQSLELTQKVLDDTKRLERILEKLRPIISEGLCKMDEIQKHRNVLSENGPDDGPNADYEIQLAVMKKVDVDSAENLTNCQICQMTCHYPCAFRDDKDKRRCTAIDGKTGFCRVCPNKCIWTVHFNQTFRWEYHVETRRGTVESLREKYNGTALTTIELVNVLENEFKAIAKDVLRLVAKAAGCIQRLEQMALHFSPWTTSSYLTKMIESERQKKLPGYEQRIANLRNLLEMAELSDRIYRKEPLLPPSLQASIASPS